MDLSVNGGVQFSFSCNLLLFCLQEINPPFSRLQAREEKRREKEESRAEQEPERHSFFLLVSHTRGHCLSGTLLFSEILYIPTFNTVAAVQCSAVVSVVFSGVSPDRGKETTFKLMRLAVSCSCPSHKILKFGCFRQPPSRKGSTGDWGGYYWDYYYYKSMGIMQ